MNHKPSIIIEIEKFLKIKLKREENINRSMLQVKSNTYVLNSNNEVVGLNLQKNPVKDFPFSRDLQNITHLNLSNTQLDEISFIRFFPKLEYLNLSFNHIFEIENLFSLKDLQFLNLTGNNISSINVIRELKKISTLYLNINKIKDVEALIYLPNLKVLDLSDNLIYDTRPINELSSLQELKLAKNSIQNFPNLDNLYDLKYLTLSSNKLENLSGIQNLKNLKILDVRDNIISDIDELKHLSFLEYILLVGNEIHDLTPLKSLFKLKVIRAAYNLITYFSLENFKNLGILDLSNNPLKFIDISPENRLKELYLANTVIGELEAFEYLQSLNSLYLSKCLIEDINVLSALSKLKTLDLSDNNVYDVYPLIALPLKTLILSNNPVEDIYILFSNDSNQLQHLKVDETGFSRRNNLVLSHRENHLDFVRNRFIIHNSVGETLQGYFPVKILLLGNHGSGKSQFLNYFLNDALIEKSETTDILQIKPFKENANSILPSAIFYDFGGQDFYHGLYRIFLSNQSIHCLFWHEKSNCNRYELDINGSPIQNFNVNYWIGQKKYNEYNKGFNDDLFLIETHSDVKESKKPTYFVFNEIEKVPRQQFFISLKWNSKSPTTLNKNQLINLDHLKFNLIELIHEKRVSFDQKKWYIDFIKFITSKQRREQAVAISDLIVEIEDSKLDLDSKIQFLKTELDQLHRKGLVLYYKDDISDFVWLNPLKIVNHIKEKVLILGEIQKAKGILNKKYFEDKKIDPNILSLLQLQKVIFLHKYGMNDKKEIIDEYIIPNYLPLVNKENDVDYDLTTFGIHNQHLFTLKFADFIPLGLINQLICFFGSLPDVKKFWRNQIVFTFENKCKLLIYLDNENLEIKVFGHFSKVDIDSKERMIKYIYSCILCFYWDFKLISFQQYLEYEEQLVLIEKEGYDSDWKIKYEISKAFYEVIDSKVPSDLFISLDGKVFVNAYNLTTFDELKETKISTYDMVSNVVQLDSPKEKAVYVYKIFTNRRLKKMKKVFVSYSHANYKEMEQLTKYLIGFVRNKEIESWTDLKLQSGVKVKDEILQNLEDADIVILLISQDFIASDFIYDYELQRAMQKKIAGRGEIIPVVLSSCSIFDLKLNVTGDEGLMNEIKMGDYYFTPQGPNNSLLPIEQWKNESQAWMEVYKDIKKKIKM